MRLDHDIPLKIRSATEEDIPFICNAWLKSYRSGYLCREVANTIYFAEHHKLIDRLIKKSNVMIACNPEDPTQIFGFSCNEIVDNVYVLHFIYIKQTYRNLGIATHLLKNSGFNPKVGSCHTHSNKVSVRLQAKYNSVYHPYLLMELEESSDVPDKHQGDQ